MNDYTVEEIIQFTINILGGINIPVLFVDDIGIPISKGIANLTVAKKMLEEAKGEVENDERETDAE